MRPLRILLPTILTLGLALWLALRPAEGGDGPLAVEGQSQRIGARQPEAPPSVQPRRAALPDSPPAQAEPPANEPSRDAAPGSESGVVAKAELAGSWSGDQSSVGRRGARTANAPARLSPSTLPEGARFGAQVALSGPVAAVAAPSSGENGAVFVFERAGDTWRELARLTAPDGERCANFGASLALRDDWLAIGAPGDAETEGALLLYQRRAGSWALAETLHSPEPAAGDGWGAIVALADARLVVGSTAGPCFTYEPDRRWMLTSRLELRGPTNSLTLGQEYGARVVSSGEHAGFELFFWSHGIWVFWDEGIALDEHVFEGCPPASAGVALTRSGPRTLLAAACGSSLRIFGAAGPLGADELEQLPLPPSQSARPLAWGAQRVLVGDPGSKLAGASAGAVLRFAQVEDSWHAERELVAPDADAGDALGSSLDAEGPYVLAGAPGGGYALVWKLAPPTARRPGR